MKFIGVLLFIITFMSNNLLLSSNDSTKEIVVRQQHFIVKEMGGEKRCIDLNVYQESNTSYLSFNEVIKKYFHEKKDSEITDLLKKYMLSDGQSLRYATENQILLYTCGSAGLFLVMKFFHHTDVIEE